MVLPYGVQGEGTKAGIEFLCSIRVLDLLWLCDVFGAKPVCEVKRDSLPGHFQNQMRGVPVGRRSTYTCRDRTCYIQLDSRKPTLIQGSFEVSVRMNLSKCVLSCSCSRAKLLVRRSLQDLLEIQGPAPIYVVSSSADIPTTLQSTAYDIEV